MKFNPYLGLALLGASFCLVAGKPSSDYNTEKVPTAEELKCKEKEIVTQGGWGNYYCELHPKHQKPLFYCENDSDCVKACKEHKYPEKCKEMTTCDDDKNSDQKICNDLAKCNPDDTCDGIGNINNGFASLKCEERKGHDGPRCFFNGRIVMSWGRQSTTDFCCFFKGDKVDDMKSLDDPPTTYRSEEYPYWGSCLYELYFLSPIQTSWDINCSVLKVLVYLSSMYIPLCIS